MGLMCSITSQSWVKYIDNIYSEIATESRKTSNVSGIRIAAVFRVGNGLLYADEQFRFVARKCNINSKKTKKTIGP
jgi:hypothetical protein